MEPEPVAVEECVRRALAEDLGRDGDLSGTLAVPGDRTTAATVRAKAEGVLAGMPVALACLRQFGPELVGEVLLRDGQALVPGQAVLRVQGNARAVLAVERTLLNFLQRLCGVATLTRKLVDAVAGTAARIFDTRKTTPGLRLLEKYAVRQGGGHNHRIGLFDQIMLKENHFALARPLGYEELVRRACAAGKGPVVAEARTQEEARCAVRGGAAVVMLDNFVPGPELRAGVQTVREAAKQLGRTVEVEVSGGVTLANVRAFADCGVDRISAGALTHSAPALDLAMKVEGVA